MSVRKRRTSKGLSKEYHYEFMLNGKRYRGVCEKCTTEKAALAYEKEIKETTRKLSEQKNINALIENFRQELTGGVKIYLDNAFERYLAKPRKKVPSKKQQQINRSQWNDFLEFMKAKFPKIEDLDKVTKLHAEAYIKQLQDSGKFTNKVKYKRKYNKKTVEHSYKTQTSLSGRTINAYHKTLKSVFSRLKEDAGIIYNPFDFEMINNESESREAFTPEELKLIENNLNDFVKPIFVIGVCTGLSESDICSLKWNEIYNGWITRKRQKTGALLDIPILPPLEKFLAEQKNDTGNNEYVLPEHHEMYRKNPSGVSYRVKCFLESLGIKTTKKTKERSRAVSIKDVHSLRHTFAYLAGCYQIPLPVVQSILGHMSDSMTRHYQSHADREAKEKYLAQMPNFLYAPDTPKQVLISNELEREQLAELSRTLPIEDIREILQKYLKNDNTNE